MQKHFGKKIEIFRLLPRLKGTGGGASKGTGVTSSLAADDSNHATGAGYSSRGSAYTLENTWLGDTDLNGVVTYADLQNMVPTARITDAGT